MRTTAALGAQFLILALLVVACLLVPASIRQRVPTPKCNTPTTRFCDALMSPTPGWRGPVFALSQDYPSWVPPSVGPWLRYDPTTQPRQYANAVLGYVFEGNLRDNVALAFDPRLNQVRRWYHAPWQDFGVNGREFVHGLTRERSSRPGELHRKQTDLWHNYAVGLYNEAGGYAIGRVWANHGAPDPTLARFPEGTVATKLLFTTAPVTQVPYLKGSPEWTAYVYADPHNPSPLAEAPRKLTRVRLLQVDIAVKHACKGCKTGWVFATFIYGGGAGGECGKGWRHVSPVGAMWGNDPDYQGDGPFKEAWLNKPEVQLPHYGWQGRVNGPVDNPKSSCLSCHATAQAPAAPDMYPPSGQDPKRWFLNYPSGTPFAPPAVSTDYSLQLSTGIQNFMLAQGSRGFLSPAGRTKLFDDLRARDPRPPRDGGTNH